jgi:hypothetical protein
MPDTATTPTVTEGTAAPPAADFSFPITGDIGNSAPPLNADDYLVRLALMPSPNGPPLLLESASAVRARYAYFMMTQLAKLTGMPETQAAESLAMQARRDAEIAAFATLSTNYGQAVRHYYFKFRVPTVYDVENAEAVTLAPRTPVVGNSSPIAGQLGQGVALHPADPETEHDPEGKYAVRGRSRFRRHLAARTFIATDYPGFLTSGAAYDAPVYAALSLLPNAIQEYVLSEVATRISFNGDVLAFLETLGPSS